MPDVLRATSPHESTSTSRDVMRATAPHDPFCLHRLPSPGLSSHDVPPHLPSPTRLMDDASEIEYYALKAAFLHTGRSTDSGWEDSSFPDELPRDFFRKLATMVATDREIQRGIAIGDVQLWGESLCARFLQECIRDQTYIASRTWRSLHLKDKQDLLLAYSCGPPTPDFFVNMMAPKILVSECGSSSTDFEVESDVTTV